MPIRRLATAVAIPTLTFAAALNLAQAPAAKAQPATSQSWIGTGSDPNWDSPGNWSTGAAPSGTLSELAFPDGGATCLNFDCAFSVDDIPGLEIGTLAIDPGENYLIVPATTSDSLSLSSGIEFDGTTAETNAPLVTNLEVPLALAAPQTWTLAGVPRTPSQLTVDSVTGTYPLTLSASSGAVLATAALNTGPLTVEGGGTLVVAQPSPGSLTAAAPPPPPIVGSPGVTIERDGSITFSRPGTLSGPITVARGSNSTIQVGDGTPPDATVTVSGGLTLRADTNIDFSLDSAAAPGKKPQPSTNYSRLTATGDVNLNSAALGLSEGFAQGSDQCASLKGGQTYTVISAYGAIDGTFAGIANDQVVPIGDCSWPNTPSTSAALVRYQAKSVTVTVVGGAQIKALVAQTLTPTGATIESVRANRGYTEGFDAPAIGTLALTWTETVRRKRVTVAQATNTANKVGPRRFAIKLTAAGRKLLSHANQLKLTAGATFTSVSGNQTKASKRITLN